MRVSDPCIGDISHQHGLKNIFQTMLLQRWKTKKMLENAFLKTDFAIITRGSVAEWSKALVLGTSLKGRGFESHRCQKIFCLSGPHGKANYRI